MVIIKEAEYIKMKIKSEHNKKKKNLKYYISETNILFLSKILKPVRYCSNKVYYFIDILNLCINC